uniref:flavin reductase family protein n=1 Tax=Candidatus Fimenecus sp. TaxID=3022888 RepID=UPI00402924D3
MSKKTLPGATLLAPLPAVMVSVGDSDNANVITVAWTGIVCSQPPRLYVSVRHDRFSYDILKRCGEFVVNLTSEKLLAACDYCGIRSGRDIDKFAEMGFTKERGDVVAAPMIAESPINLECKVFDVLPLGSHDMFLADIVAVHADEGIIVDGKIDYAAARLVNYQHGEYYATGRQLGRFGFAAQRKFISRYGKGVNVVLPKGGLTRRKRK